MIMVYRRKREKANETPVQYFALMIVLNSSEVLSAGCRSSGLQKGVSIDTSCRFQIQDVCQAVCVLNGTVIWKRKTRCLSNGTWSSLPQCQYPFRYSLKKVKCENIINGAKNTFCIEMIGRQFLPASAKKILCPELSHLRSNAHNCSREPGTECTLTCENVTSVLRCLPNGKWSHVPNCPSSGDGLCPPLKYADLLNCTRNPGESCKIQCPSGRIVQELSICLPTLEWSPLPSCNFREQCAKESLSPNVKFVQPSCKSSIQVKCKVGCYVRIFFPGARYNIRKLVFLQEAVCESTGEWSGLPDCEKAKKVFWDIRIQNSLCPVPKVELPVILQKNCSNIAGSVCIVRCEKGFIQKGAKSIRCSNKTWTGFPKCEKNNYCKPKISSNVQFVVNCSFKYNEKCQVRCRNSLALIGPNFVFCHKGTWEDVPQCVPNNMSPYAELKLKCQKPPSVPHNAKLIEKCKQEIGMSCDIKCHDPLAVMIGPNATTCLPPGTWSVVKACAGGRKYCLSFIAHEHEIIEDCTGKLPGDTCLVICKYNQDQKFNVTCLVDYQWSSPPSCSCPVPSLRDEIEFRENCTYKTPGEKCLLTCKSGFSMVGANSITCRKELHWSSLPTCKKSVCPKPNLPDYLIFYDGCISKTTGDYCRLECREGGNLIGEDKITCVNGSHWTVMPTCSCVTPFLSDDLEAKENCDSKVPGEKCLLKCKEKLEIVDQNFIFCQNNTKWTSLPTCIKRVCPPPPFQNVFMSSEDCVTKRAGEHCQVECKEGGMLIGSPKLTCINGTHWSHIPRCTCPPPNLEASLMTSDDCSNKLPGQLCSLMCKPPFESIDNGTILCQNNTRWTTLPECQKKICPKPQLPVTHSYEEDCTAKMPTEKCRLSCKQGGTLLGSDFITCTNDMLWSEVPICSCPAPNLPPELQTNENCEIKRIGEKCLLSCKDNAELLGNRLITCDNNTRWNSLPICRRKFCPKPHLMNGLIFSEDCTSKITGEKCQLECKGGGEIIGINFITCINTEYWTKIPKCSCPLPVLSEDLEAAANCRQNEIGTKCYLACKHNMSLIGKDFILCGNDLKWTILPKCKKNICQKPKLTQILAFKEDCTSLTIGEHCQLECKEEGEIIGNNRITCINVTQWTALPKCTCPLPALTSELKMKENCKSKQVSQTCHLECKQNLSLVGFDYIICTNDTKWSKLPNCKRSVCSKPLLPATHSFDEDCSSKALGQSCRLKCKEGGKFLTSDSIVCLNETKWTPFPKCSCPDPILKGHIQLEGHCTQKQPGDICHLSCKNNLTIIGENYILCKNDTTWTSQPSCKLERCPLPKVPNYLLLNEDCSFKLIGGYCHLSCKEGGSMLGSGVIKCENTSDWSIFPKCTCPKPKLRDKLESKSNCTNVMPGQKCHINCKGKLHLKGNDFIICLNTSQWSSLPKCVSQICRQPVLTKILSFQEDCSSKEIGETCQLKCSQGGNIIGKKEITCLEGLNWTKLPTCSCPPPVLKNYLEAERDCASKRPNELCRLRCKFGGKLIGTNHIKCMGDLRWSRLPDCTCAVPKLSKNIITKENCSNKRRGAKCNLSCKSGFVMSGKNFITCENDTKWSSEPNCRISFCPKPFVPADIFAISDNCTYKSPGQICKLNCTQGGKITHQERFKCLNGTRWGPLPECTCPVPVLRNELNFREDCSSKRVGDTCNLKCKGNLKITGKDFITCRNNTKWDVQPICKKNICRKPFLPEAVLQAEENCAIKSVGESCKLICKEGGKILGRNSITCINETHWSTFPDCACPAPNLTLPLRTKEDCKSKRIGETCKLNCGIYHAIVGSSSIRCKDNTKWTAVPKCERIVCPSPILSETVIRTAENCSLKRHRQKCKLVCTEGGQILGPNFISCDKGIRWSSVPDCACPAPSLGTRLETKENCRLKKKGQSCALRCKPGMELVGNDSIKCLNDTKWSSVPKCQIITCSLPELPDSLLKFSGPCSGKVPGQKCAIECKVGLIVAPDGLKSSSQLTCLNETHWSPLPECTCQRPKLKPAVIETENCSLKQKGERCVVRCHTGLEMFGDNFLVCLNITHWTESPVCRKRQACSMPKLPKYLTFENECFTTPIQGMCRLNCTYGGDMVGNNYIQCINNNQWSKMPDCYCPSLLLPAGLATTNNCKHVRRGEHCNLTCSEKRGVLIGPAETWCTDDGFWFPDPVSSHQPRCFAFPYCSTPQLPEFLEFIGNCSKISAFGSCKVQCNQGGMLIGENAILCSPTTSDVTSWTDPPKCTCPAPKSTNSYFVRGNCNMKHISENCEVECKNNFDLPQNEFFCQNNAQWSSPNCGRVKCSEPVLHEGLEFTEDCRNKLYGDYCKVKCKNDPTGVANWNLLCRGWTNWTEQPSCKIKFCPTPVLPEFLETVNDCSFKRPDEECPLQCNQGGTLLEEDNNISCLKDLKWSETPNCTCSIAESTDSYNIAEDCRMKKISESCEIQCKSIYELPEYQFVCQSNGKWSSPNCRRVKCTEPVLPEILEFTEDCKNKYYGELCKVKCKNDPSGKLTQNLLCSGWANWGKLPTCDMKFCPIPSLPDFLETVQDCTLKLPGEECFVQCSQEGFLLDANKIKCLEDKTWTEPPQCTCPNAKSTSSYNLAEDCRMKKISEKCEIQCKNVYELPEFQFLCQNNGKWSSPNCRRVVCSEPILHEFLEFTEDCANKFYGDFCKVKCRNDPSGKLTQNLLCRGWSNWGELPTCDINFCPPPSLPEFLEPVQDCRSMLPGEECFVQCNQGGFLLDANNKITCLEDKTWTEPPKCTCADAGPTASYNVAEDCRMKQISEKCEVQCKNIFELPEFEFVCQNNGKWKSPNCRRVKCSEPVLHELLEFAEDCRNKFYGESCIVKCRNDPTGEKSHNLVCSGWTFWSEQPSCNVPRLCPVPSLPKFLFPANDCVDKAPRDECVVQCNQGGTLLGTTDKITCLEDRTWTEPPKCTCADPVSTVSYTVSKDCRMKQISEKCAVECRNIFELPQNDFVCQNDGQWSTPNCGSVSCAEPILNEFLEFAEDCSNKNFGDTCVIKCRNNPTSKGENLLCINAGKWSELPFCGCIDPPLSHAWAGPCTPQLPGGYCVLTCEGQFAYMFCNDDFTWRIPPECI